MFRTLLSRMYSSSSSEGIYVGRLMLDDTSAQEITMSVFHPTDCSYYSRALVIKEKIGPVLTIGINRPSVKNCVNNETARQLLEAFQEADKDNEVKSIVLHGIGGSFCAGYDLTELSSMPEGTQLPEEYGPMGPSRFEMSKPTIAAVSGYAVAGGLELALMSDLRVVEDTAVMGVFCRRFGVPLIDGGTVRLPALIGLSRAMDLILTGRAVSAKEALEIGLANRIVACGTALGQAVNLAMSLTKFPQECMRRDKKSAYYSVFEAKSLQDALRFEFENAKHVITQESVTGAKRFANDGIGRHGKFRLDDIQYEKSKL